jgi:hypothetical protein
MSNALEADSPGVAYIRSCVGEPLKRSVRRLTMNSQVSSEWILKATRRYVAQNRNSHPDTTAAIETIGALPLYLDMGGGVGLSSDGELIGFFWDEPQAAKPETDPHLRFLALVVGSRKYPELASLLPKRSVTDRDCPVCEGTGFVSGLAEMGVNSNVIHCYCGGAGWLPSNVPDPPGY